MIMNQAKGGKDTNRAVQVYEVQVDVSTLDRVFAMFGCDVYDFDVCGVQKMWKRVWDGNSCDSLSGDTSVETDMGTVMMFVMVNRVLGRIWKDRGLIIPFDEEVVKYMETTDHNLRRADCFEAAEERLCKLGGKGMLSLTVPLTLFDRYEHGVNKIMERYRRYYSERLQAYYDSLCRQEDVDMMLQECMIEDRRHLNVLCQFTSLVQAGGVSRDG